MIGRSITLGAGRVALAALLALGASCDRDPGPIPSWTVLVYMAADNGLSSAAEADLAEMAAAAASPHVQVVVQLDLAGATARRYRISEGAPVLLADLGELDMSAPQTLTDFLSWGAAAYPADRTVLVLWSDGNGWDELDAPSSPPPPIATTALTLTGAVPSFGPTASRYSIFQDQDPYGAKPPFTANAAVRRAIEASGIRLDLLGFDACTMSTLEALYEFRAVADYVVASQELIESHGWNYAGWLGALAAHPRMSPADLAAEAVERYAEYYEGTFYPARPAFERYLGLAAFRTDALEPLAAAVDALAAGLSAALADPARRDGTLALIASARAGVQDVDPYVKPFVYADLADLARLLGDTSVEQALASATVAEYHGTARPGAHGMSIVFFDLPNAADFATFDPNYANWDAVASKGNGGEFINSLRWDEFLATYYVAAGLLP